MLDAAVTAAGSDDFGPADFRTGLAVLCDSVEAEAQLNDIGRFAVAQNVIGSLANRLKIHDWMRANPSVVDERIVAPLVVVGMFRAGTTFLSQLLDQDPHNRALLRWEAWTPWSSPAASAKTPPPSAPASAATRPGWACNSTRRPIMPAAPGSAELTAGWRRG